MADNTIFTDAASDIFDALSATATYTPITGTAATVRAIKDTYPRFTGEALPTAERLIVISILRADWSDNPVAGDTITIGSDTYTVLGLLDPFELPGTTALSVDDEIEWRIKVR